MNKQKIAIIITFFGLFIVLAIETSFKVIEKNNQKEYDFVVNNIINEVKKCIENEICDKENTTLKTLYEKTDNETFINPITNEAFSENAYVTVNTYEFISE